MSVRNLGLRSATFDNGLHKSTYPELNHAVIWMDFPRFCEIDASLGEICGEHSSIGEYTDDVRTHKHDKRDPPAMIPPIPYCSTVSLTVCNAHQYTLYTLNLYCTCGTTERGEPEFYQCIISIPVRPFSCFSTTVQPNRNARSTTKTM